MAQLINPSVVIISDVSVGYGTPQIVSLAKSFSEVYGANVIILEPDQPERPSVDLEISNVVVERQYTATHPYTASGQVEFNMMIQGHLDTIKPDVVVLCAFLGVGGLLKMKHKPKMMIYFGLEHTDGREYESNLLRMSAPLFDFAIFPEENRALLDTPRIGMEKKPYAIVYNGSSTKVSAVKSNEKNGKIFYGGLLHPELTFSDYFFGGELDAFKIDLFGLVDGYPNREEVLNKLKSRQGGLRYGGYLPSGPSFSDIIKYYDFSIVLWNPKSESTLYAAPNKFFDAIQAGVPIISAPHPLCEKLIIRYNCGIVMGGFAIEDLKLSLKQANALKKSEQYNEIIEHFLPIAKKDLCWDTQFKKIEKMIEQVKL
ncbi:MAG: glycosyltransferase [Caulobacterales bacterium]|nr:glycosyltransferase [Caulobacterales bacterium]